MDVKQDNLQAFKHNKPSKSYHWFEPECKRRWVIQNISGRMRDFQKRNLNKDTSLNRERRETTLKTNFSGRGNSLLSRNLEEEIF